MADNNKINEAPENVETTDRGLLDFMKKKEGSEEGNKTPEAEVITSGVENMHVSEPKSESKFEYKPEHEFKDKEEEKKHGGLLEKLHRSDSSSSSSSDEEGDDEEKKKKKKEKKEKKEKKLEGIHKEEHDTNVPIEKVNEQEYHQELEEKKGGFLDKIKEKLPGKSKTTEHEAAATTPPVAATTAPVAAVAEQSVEGEKEKKGFLEKIKEKIPGFHPKSDAHNEEKKDHD